MTTSLETWLTMIFIQETRLQERSHITQLTIINKRRIVSNCTPSQNMVNKTITTILCMIRKWTTYKSFRNLNCVKARVRGARTNLPATDRWSLSCQIWWLNGPSQLRTRNASSRSSLRAKQVTAKTTIKMTSISDTNHWNLFLTLWFSNVKLLI